MKKIFLFIFFMFIFASNVSAEACDAYDIKRLKELANGVEITYELQEPLVLEEGEVKDVYKINVSGLTDELIIFNDIDNESYTVNTNFNDYVFFGGKKQLEIASVNCSNTLKKMTLKLPVYNYYSDGDFCSDSDNKKLSVCQQWVEEKISEKEFDYVTNNEVEENYDDYRIDKITIVYIICFVIICVIAGLVVFFKKKKERLV